MSGKRMKCGHTAQGTIDGVPACVICGCTEVDESPPDLTGRKSQCGTCGRVVDSDPALAFFGHRPGREYDEHYDGCQGWD